MDLNEELAGRDLEKCYRSNTLMTIFSMLDLEYGTHENIVSEYCNMFDSSNTAVDSKIYETYADKNQNFFYQLLKDYTDKLNITTFQSFFDFLKMNSQKEKTAYFLDVIIKRILEKQTNILQEIKYPTPESDLIYIKLNKITNHIEALDINQLNGLTTLKFNNNWITLIFHPDQIENNKEIYEAFKDKLKSHKLCVIEIDLSRVSDENLDQLFLSNTPERARPIIVFYDEYVDKVCQSDWRQPINSLDACSKKFKFIKLYNLMYDEYVKTNRKTNRFLFFTFTNGLTCRNDWMVKECTGGNRTTMKVGPLLLVKGAELNEKGLSVFLNEHSSLLNGRIER